MHFLCRFLEKNPKIVRFFGKHIAANPEAQMKSEKERAPTNTREIRKKNNRSMFWMVIGTLIFVGGGVTAVVYGPTALLGVLPILLIGVGLIALPYLVLKGLEIWLHWVEEKE